MVSHFVSLSLSLVFVFQFQVVVCGALSFFSLSWEALSAFRNPRSLQPLAALSAPLRRVVLSQACGDGDPPLVFAVNPSCFISERCEADAVACCVLCFVDDLLSVSFLGHDMARVDLRPMVTGTLQRLASDKRFICQTAAQVLSVLCQIRSRHRVDLSISRFFTTAMVQIEGFGLSSTDTLVGIFTLPIDTDPSQRSRCLFIFIVSRVFMFFCGLMAHQFVCERSRLSAGRPVDCGVQPTASLSFTRCPPLARC